MIFKLIFEKNKEDISTISTYTQKQMMKEFITPPRLLLLFQLPMLGLVHYAQNMCLNKVIMLKIKKNVSNGSITIKKT